MNSYVGVDVHKDSCHGTVQTESGETVKQGYFKNAHPGFDDFFDGIEEAEAVVEAGAAWQPVYDWLDENGFDVKLADPRKVRIIAEVKIKTDARDSEALADLLRADLIPEIYVPCDERRELRKIVRRRGKLVQERAKYKNRIRAELRKRGIDSDGYYLGTQKAKRWLRSLEIDSVDDYLEIMNSITERIRNLEKEIKEIAGDMEEAQLLMTIPGVSYYSALTIIAEIATVERFPSSEHLCSYAGLVPSTTQSGSKETHGHIQGGRPLLRWIVCQCAHIHVHNADSHLTRFYERLDKEKPGNHATVSTGRKLLKVIYWMLKEGEEFRPEGYDPRQSC
ncbi:hypothetical protein AKJ41_00695 [candidate division MSBL1 archaeon SCGC-AAA259O05]|uniref:Uncharacterized protein n=1 Tax=candidate division MSBL1 archaeon SCGC-AAA259O05 TaxID=1698271 RepID=A0A133V5I7_9EURY|nr:hypothetical protein AKJ41_00695 [candidate division MSBL1 archaeon SCGC-AAA259O05]